MASGKKEPSGREQSAASPHQQRRAGGMLFWFSLITAALGAACYVYLGPAVFQEAAIEGAELFTFVLPRFVCGIFIAGFMLALVPRDFVARWLGGRSGFKGLLMATLAGMLTPGGPMMAWPVVIALYRAGAHQGPLVAYVTAWSVLGIHRTIIWELPLMGPRFTLIKTLSSILLPLLAGFIAARMPVALYPEAAGGKDAP